MRKNYLASLWKSLLEAIFPELRMVRLNQSLVEEDERMVALSGAPEGYQEGYQEPSPH